MALSCKAFWEVRKGRYLLTGVCELSLGVLRKWSCLAVWVKGQIPWWAFFGSILVCWSQAKQRSKKYLPSGLFIRPTQTVIIIYLVLRHFQKEIWVNLGVVLHTAVLVHSGHCERHSYTQGFWSWWGARKTYSHHRYGNNHVMKTTTWMRQSCSLGWSVQLFGGDGSVASNAAATSSRVGMGSFGRWSSLKPHSQ